MNREKLDVFAGKPFLQTKPGRIVCVPSLGQDEILALQFLVVLDNPPDDRLHGFVIAGKKAPVYPFPVFGSSRPGFVGGIKNPPPEHHVLGFSERLFGIDGEKVFCPLLIYGDFKAGKLFRQLCAKVLEETKETVPD